MSAVQSSRGPAALVVAILALAVAWGSAFTVSEREYAVVLEFGRPVRQINQPGLHFKIPLIQSVQKLPATLQFWSSGPKDVLEALPTADGKKIEISVWAIWKITEPKQFLTKMRTVENAEHQVVQRVRASVRDVVTGYNLPEVVRSSNRKLVNSFGLNEEAVEKLESTDVLPNVEEETSIEFGREKILNEIRDHIMAQLKSGSADDASHDRGIEFVDVGVSNIGFTESVRRKAFERLAAYMEAIAARYINEGEQRKQEIINEAKAEYERLIGEGEEQSKRLRGQVEAEIIELYADAIRTTGDFYNFQRTLSVYENSLSGDTKLILTTDSELLRMLKGMGSAEQDHGQETSGQSQDRSDR